MQELNMTELNMVTGGMAIQTLSTTFIVTVNDDGTVTCGGIPILPTAWPAAEPHSDLPLS